MSFVNVIVLLVVGCVVGQLLYIAFLVMREFWGWSYGWVKKKSVMFGKPKKSNTMWQSWCRSCNNITWHRRKLHDLVCNTCDTSKRVEGSNRSIML